MKHFNDLLTNYLRPYVSKVCEAGDVSLQPVHAVTDTN